MNKIFKTKYNYLTKNSVVTSELAKNKGKSCLIKTLLTVSIVLPISLEVGAYHNEFTHELQQNADGSVIYFDRGDRGGYYHFDKLDMTSASPNGIALALNLDSIGYPAVSNDSSARFYLELEVGKDSFRRGYARQRDIFILLSKGNSIKASGENGIAIKVQNEFRKDRHDPAFLALSDEDKANKIKDIYENLYTKIIIENRGHISSEKGNVIDFSAFNRKDLFGKAVKKLELALGPSPVGTIVANYGVISAPENKAAFIGSDYRDNLELYKGSKIEGNIYLGKGDDYIYLWGADIAKLKVLEGSYKNNPDALDNAEKNYLELRQELTGSSESVGTYEDKAIRNFGAIVILNGGILNLTGNMTSNSGRVGFIQINKDAELNIAPKNTSSNIRLDYSIFNNEGIIDLSKNNLPNDTLTISGDYGKLDNNENTGELRVNTFWHNPDIQQTDKLIIEGNHKGTTTVKAYYQGNESIFGDVTRSDVEKNGGLLTPVVEIKGEEKGKFEGTAPTTNAGEAQLVRHGNKYYWTLTALEQPAPQPEPVQPVPQPEQPAPQPEPVQPVPQPAVPANNDPMIYAEQIAGYVQTQRIAREALLQENGKLQTRMGSLQAPLTPQTWAHVGGGYTQEQGKDRLAYKSKAKFVQIGSDLFVNSNENGVRRGGVMVSFNRADNKFYDKYHAQNGYIVADKLVGKGKLETATLGLYSTWYGNNGLYLDTSANVGWIGAKYTIQNGNKAKNHGFSFMANTEVGKEIAISTDGRWNFVPQAQLTLLETKMSGFNDGIRDMKSSHQTVLRGRIGAGVSFNAEKGKNANSFFASLNLVHDFMGRKTELEVGRDRITEHYAPTFGEVSIGGVLPLGKQLSAQANLNYTRALSKTNTLFSGSGKEAYQGYVGLKYIW